MTELTLEEGLKHIQDLDKAAMEQAKRRWDSVAKPLNSLGLLEEAIIKIAGIQKDSHVNLEKKAVVICCGDNGIVEEGVTQTGQEVTGIVTQNFAKGESCVCLMAKQAGAAVLPIDLGVASELSGTEKDFPDLDHQIRIWDRKISRGTRNFLYGPAMERRQAVQALETGILAAGHLKEKGYSLIATGEMGIGNTTTSSAVVSVLLKTNPETVTGRGAGLNKEGLEKKIQVIKQGIEKNQPDRSDGIDVLAKVGGFDLAGLAGLMIGGAIYRIPVVLDGFISGAAALAAAAVCPRVTDFLLASHVSAEPAGKMVLDALSLKPVIYGEMCLGEGTGAATFFPLLDMAQMVYCRMSTFQEIDVKEYQQFV